MNKEVEKAFDNLEDILLGSYDVDGDEIWNYEGTQDCLVTIRDALEHPKTQWQPIETAPEGRDVLVFSEETGECFVAFWGTCKGGYDYEWLFARSKDACFVVKTPTHWMPLPEPPKK